MSYYRLEVKIIGRSKGLSSVAAAAYRSGEKLQDERTGIIHDYSTKKGVEGSIILAPENSPDWVYDRSSLWNETEFREDKSTSPETAQLAREVVICFPRELSKEQREALAKKFVSEQLVSKGMIADVSFHNNTAKDGGENPHAHIMLTMRNFDGEKFLGKNRSWNNAVFTKDDYIVDSSSLVGLRGKYADYVNDALADSGSNARVSHLTNEENGKEPARERIPQAVYQMDKKNHYNAAFYSRLEAKNNVSRRTYKNAVAPSRGGGENSIIEDYEYMKARQSVEVDTRNYIAPAKPSHHLSDYSHAQNNLDNDIGLDI